MNIRNVLRTYSLLRQLTDDETALLETLRGMNDAERESLVVALQPERVTTKKAGKKSASKSSSKSPRAQSLSGAIQRAGKSPANREPLCTFIVNVATQETCATVADDPIHDMTYSSSHEFAPGAKMGKSPAPTAPRSSSANGGAGSGTANIEDEMASAGAVAGGSNE